MTDVQELMRSISARAVGVIPKQPDALIIFLPHAGGAAHGFLPWTQAIPNGVAAAAVEYSGHGLRMREALPQSIQEIGNQLANELSSLRLPLIIAGHSFGALAAYETASLLSAREKHAAGLFLSGAIAPHRRRRSNAALLPDDQLATTLVSRGGFPAELAQTPEALALYLPVIRSDLDVVARYTEEVRNWSTVRCAAVVVGGEGDQDVPVGELSHWSDLINGPTQIHTLSGDHFFYLDHFVFIRSQLEWLVNHALRNL
jgi:pyochelin biosynthetic protein PchC